MKMQAERMRGFTVIEMLVAVGIISIVGTIIISILYISLRGTKKADLVVVAKDNGDLALSQMIRQIRFAKSIDSPAACIPSTTVSSVTFTSLADNGQTTLSCPAGGSTTITSNSASLIDDSNFTVSNCSFTCSQEDMSLPQTITIQFTLTPTLSSSFVETTGSFTFESAVTHRNFNR